MPLVPRSDDPGREAVLAEMKKTPKAFGEDIPTAATEPVRDLSGSGLVQPKKPEAPIVAAAEPTATADVTAAHAAAMTAWVDEVLQNNMPEIIALFPDMGEEQLNALLTAEAAGSGRKGLLVALSDQLQILKV